MRRANDLGARPGADHGEACRGADIVVSAVTADQAVAAGLQCAPHLQAGQVYIDLNSVSPATKADVAAGLATSGADFIEWAVMAPVAEPGIRVPILAGGPRAAEIAERLNPLGMDITAVADTIGVASATKLCRSIVIKGMEALMVDLSMVTARNGVLPAVLASLTASYPGMDWAKLVEVMPGRVRRHGVRRAAEMREVARMMAEAGLDGALAEAIADRHAAHAGRNEALPAPAMPVATAAT
jgi:3-hydroxyisobutyrate dehydrogenase-like beta-hydroxyacid dehydrogenase